jgi:metallo-beta-lactamase family protein
MSVHLAFHGAAGTVTGSRHLLTADDSRILVDCGLFQGLKKLRLLNWDRPAFDPASVDHLLLTHTHIDHAGYLPRLVREGYAGKVHATRATRDLAGILLLDAAKIQEEDAAHANRRGWSKHSPAEPLFTTEDAERAIDRLRGVPYDDWLELGGGVRARFANAGHILGSAMVEVRAPTFDGELTVLFSGDLGRYDVPLHPDPMPPPPCDVMVIESTYGSREHDETPIEEQVGGPLRRTLEEGGTVLVPAFAVGRAQLVTLMLTEAIEDGRLPDIPIHIDSPMAVDATQVYRHYVNEANLDSRVVDEGRLFPHRVRYHRTVDESKELNDLPGPRVIISSSGMLAGGRVLHHLRRLLPDEKNLLCLVGYQAAGTRGRALIDGKDHLKMHGRKVPVRARFVNVHGLSAHADRSELIRWATSGDRLPRAIFCVHGEPDSSTALAKALADATGAKTFTPELHEEFDLEATLA